MRLHNITESYPRKNNRRVGRGIAAGQGKTAGRGTKGQKSRTGANSNIPRTFEGGATPLVSMLPKLKGFKSRQIKSTTVSLSRIKGVFAKGDTVSLISLMEKGVINDTEALKGVKIVGASRASIADYQIDLSNPKLVLSKSLLSLISPK